MGELVACFVGLDYYPLVENYIGYGYGSMGRASATEDGFSIEHSFGLLAYAVYVSSFEERDDSMMTQEFVRALKRRLVVAAVIGMVVWVPVGRGQAPAAPAATPGDVHARGDIAGDWQGTLQAGRPLRVVLRVTKGDKGWSGKIFIITDQGGQPVNVSGLMLDGSAMKFSVDQMGASYEGTVSADGSSMVGTMTGGPGPQPFTLVRATKETAWEIPPPPTPPKADGGGCEAGV